MEEEFTIVDELDIEPEINLIKSQIIQKENEIRKLKLVLLYKSKWKKEDLREQVNRWRNIAQNSILQLFQKYKAESPNLLMVKFLESINVDPEFICYDLHNQCFDSQSQSQ